LDQTNFSLKSLFETWYFGNSNINHSRILCKEHNRSLLLLFVVVDHRVDAAEVFLKISEISKSLVVRCQFFNFFLFGVYVTLELVHDTVLTGKLLFLGFDKFFILFPFDIEASELFLQLIFASFLQVMEFYLAIL
jgi:hypothetical protein